MVIIKIDKDSIKENPNAGCNTYVFPGRTTVEEKDGVIIKSKELHRVYSLTREGKLLFSFIPTEIECSECKEKFLHTELESDAMGCGDDEFWSDAVCPKCGYFDCCEIEYEDIKSIAKAVS